MTILIVIILKVNFQELYDAVLIENWEFPHHFADVKNDCSTFYNILYKILAKMMITVVCE